MLVEAPTYDRPLKILAAHGVETTPIAMDDEGLDLDALAQALERRREAGVPLHDPHLPEPERADAQRGAPSPASPSSRASTTCSCWRTTPTGSSATTARRRRRCSSWKAERASRTRPPSRRRSRRGCASATSCCRRHSSVSSKRWRRRRTSRRCCSGRQRCSSFCAAATSSRTSSVCAHCSAHAVTRCSKRSNGSCRMRVGAIRKAATSSGSSCPKAPTPAALLERATAAGVTFVPGADFGGAAEHGSARVQLRLPGRDQRRRAPPRSPRAGTAAGLGSAHLGEIAKRPRYETRLTGWNERPAAVQPEGRAGCVCRKGTEPGATEIAVVARQLCLAQFSPLPRDDAAVTTGDTTKVDRPDKGCRA